MYSKILVPLDGSAHSEGILPYVRSFARALTLPVELLHVNDPTRLAPFSPPLQGGEYLQRVAASFTNAKEVKCTVELGDPAARIVDLAAAQASALIAMTTHGYSGAQRWLLGSVADKVLHGATNPLLLVRPAQGDGGENHRRENAFGVAGAASVDAVVILGARIEGGDGIDVGAENHPGQDAFARGVDVLPPFDDVLGRDREPALPQVLRKE